MSATDDALAKAQAKLDENVKDEPKNDKEEPKPKEEAKKVDEKTTVGDKKPEKTDEKVDDKTTEVKETEDDEGYVADEIATEEDEPEPPQRDESPKPAGLNDEQKYIYNNLPEIVTYDKDGKQVAVKTYTELPKDFDFLDKATERAFLFNMNAQELNARDLQRQFQEQSQSKNAEDFEERENLGIKSDIAELQKAGELPKFKTQPNDPKFDSDPATEEAQKVLDYMNTRNEQYLKEYQQGRPYRHIGFREAFYMYKRDNPGEIKSRAEHQEDKERAKVAEEMRDNVGLSSKELVKPAVRSGTTTRDILNKIDNME